MGKSIKADLTVIVVGRAGAGRGAMAQAIGDFLRTRGFSVDAASSDETASTREYAFICMSEAKPAVHVVVKTESE